MKRFQVTVNGNVYQVDVEELQAGQTVSAPKVSMPVVEVPQAPVAPVVTAAPAAPAPAAPAPSGATGSIRIEAPMQGKIVGIKVNVGDTVGKDQVVLILEAMKMENEIVSPGAGTIASINVTVGQSVSAGDLLASLN